MINEEDMLMPMTHVIVHYDIKLINRNCCRYHCVQRRTRRQPVKW